MQLTHEKGFLYMQGIAEAKARAVDAVWVKSRSVWRMPANLYSMRELYRIEPSAALNILGREQRAREDIHLSKKNLEDAKGDERLRPYQRADVSFLKQLPHAAIFNQQRTGKTPTALNVVKDDFDLTIVVCPASLLLQWKKEIETWVENSTVFVSKGTKGQRQIIYESLQKELTIKPCGTSTKTNFMIISYETLRNDLDAVIGIVNSTKNLQNYGRETGYSLIKVSMIVDEAHRLANHKTKQSQAVCDLGKRVSKRLALTGTPAMNHAADVYGILRFLYPDRYSSYWQFVERYFYVNDGHFGKTLGSYRRKQELQRVLELISVQRKRVDVMKWLPSKEYQSFELEADSKQMKAYKSMLNTFEYSDEDVELDASSLLAQITRLRQITLAPELLEIKAESAKEKWLLDFIIDNPDEHIIVFSSFTSYLKILKEKLGERAVMIHGEMSADQKQAAANKFQEGTKETNILLSNIVAGGTGWTLDKATTTIFLDRHYNPTLNEQAEDRMISTVEGEISGSLVIDLIVKDTIDEHIHDLVKKKVNIIKYVNDYGLGKLLNN